MKTAHSNPVLFGKALITTLLLVQLHACSNGGNPPPTVTIDVSGRVIDGPIQGAVVCVDVNGNKQCDAAEPQSMSGADGGFAFAAAVPEATPPRWVILAVIDAATARDADDGGQTLAVAGKPSVVLQALTDGAGPAVVSPLTTLAVNEMETRGLSAADAGLVVVSTLGLPAATDPNGDFSAPASDARRAVNNVARAAFLAMGHIKAGLEQGGTGASGRAVLVASLIEALPATAHIAQQLDLTRPQVDNLVQDVNDYLSSAFSREMYADVAVSGAMLLNAAAMPSPVAAIQGKQWQTVRDTGPAEFNLTCCYVGTGRLDFGNGLDYSRSAYVEGQWRTQPDVLLDLFDLNPATGEWVRRPLFGRLGDLAMIQDGAALFTATHSGLRSRYTFRESDISGRPLAAMNEIRAGIGQFLGATPAESLIFPAGSKVAFMSSIPLADNYTLGTSAAMARGPAAPASFVDLAGMMAYARTPAAPPTVPGSLPHIAAGVFAFTFDGQENAGTLTFWDAMTFFNPDGGTHILGQGSYEIRTVAGQSVLVITGAPADAIAYGCTTCLPPPPNERIIFAVREGAVRSGQLELANHIRTPALWPNERIWVDKSYTQLIDGATWDTVQGWLGIPD